MADCIHHWHIELIDGKEIGVCRKCREQKVFRQVLFHTFKGGDSGIPGLPPQFWGKYTPYEDPWWETAYKKMEDKGT